MMNLFYAKRIVSIVTILLILLFVFTGCSNMNPDDKNTGNGGDGGIIEDEDGIEGVIEFTLATVPNPAPIKNTWRVTDAGSPTSEDFTDLMVALQSVKKPRVKLEFPNIIAIPENPKPPTELLTGLILLSAPKATSIGSLTGYWKGAFAYQINLTTVDIPEVIKIGAYTFNGCTSLTSVDLPKATILKSADDWGSAFEGCTSLTTVNLPKAIDIRNFIFDDCTSLISVNLPKATHIGTGAFDQCIKLTDITIGTESASLYVLFNTFGGGSAVLDNIPAHFLNTTLTTAHGESVNNRAWKIKADEYGVNIQTHGRFKKVIIK